jgi:hypothetical protein
MNESTAAFSLMAGTGVGCQSVVDLDDSGYGRQSVDLDDGE